MLNMATFCLNIFPISHLQNLSSYESQQNICIKPTKRDIHLSIIKAFVTYNLSHFGAKHIVTFFDL